MIKQLTEEMRIQSTSGVEVYFIFETDLNEIPYFRSNPVRGIGLYDGKILSYDTSPTREHESPVEIAITWNAEEISKKIRFHICLTVAC